MERGGLSESLWSQCPGRAVLNMQPAGPRSLGRPGGLVAAAQSKALTRRTPPMINDCEIICLTPVFSPGIVGKQEDAAYRDNGRRSGAPAQPCGRRKWKLFPSIWCDSRCSGVKRGAETSRPARDRDEDRCRCRLRFVGQAGYDSLHKISHLLSLHAGEKSTSGKSALRN